MAFYVLTDFDLQLESVLQSSVPVQTTKISSCLFIKKIETCTLLLFCFTETLNLTLFLSGYHADTPITIKAEPSIWPTAAFINIHEHPL